MKGQEWVRSKKIAFGYLKSSMRKFSLLKKNGDIYTLLSQVRFIKRHISKFDKL